MPVQFAKSIDLFRFLTAGTINPMVKGKGQRAGDGPKLHYYHSSVGLVDFVQVESEERKNNGLRCSAES